MNKRILSKILATILVLIFTFSNVILLGVYAAGEELENQQTSINNTKIEFDAYFKREEKKTHSVIADINAQDAKLYLSVKVAEGNLNNANIVLDNSNFTLKEYKDEQGIIQSVDSQNNKIYFNQMTKGTDVILELPIQIKKDDRIDIDYFTKESKVILFGEYLNNKGEKSQIEKTIKVLLEINGQENVMVEQAIDKYVPFKTESAQGTLLQTTIKAGIENNNLPVKQASINIEVPVINNVKPTTVTVLGKEFSYNKENGTLTIITKNEPENNQISWPKTGLDCYKIIYLYGENSYTTEEVVLEQRVEAVIEAYNNENTKANKISEGKLTLKEKFNNNVSNTVEFNTSEIYKGFLYNNSQNETSYQTIWKTDIAYTNLVNEISLSENGDEYIISGEQAEVFLPNYAFYKTTYIHKENFERILGLDGYIDIYDEVGNKIGTINKGTQVNENNFYLFQYNNPTHKINIKTSKPIENIMGEELVIYHNKSIKSEVNYNFEQLKSFSGIKATVNQIEGRVELKEIATKAELSVNDNSLSTAISNNVEFAVALRTDSPSYQLFKDPIIEIKLPNYVENIELGNIDILFGNGELQVKDKQVIVNEDGNKIIRVTLSGEQKDYDLNSTAKGAKLFINANITTKKLMPSQEANIEMACVNQKDNSISTSTIQINFESESGVLMANSIANYNGSEQKTSLKGNMQVGKLEMNTTSKTATMNMTLVNNEKTDINGAVILGRLPFKDNKTVVSGEELGSTFDSSLQSIIVMNGIDATIYYSENGQASQDLQDSENKWTTEATTSARSYLIVLNDTFKKGETISFAYNVEIPENLGTDESAYSNYAIYYNNVGFDSPVVGVATEFTMITKYRSMLEEEGNVEVSTSENVTKGEDLISTTIQYIKESSSEQKVGLNDELTYIITVENNTYDTIKDINIVDVLSNNVKYEKSKILYYDLEKNLTSQLGITINYDEKNHNVIAYIPELGQRGQIQLQITVKVTGYSEIGLQNQCIVSNNDIYVTRSNTIEIKSPAVVTATMEGSATTEKIVENQTIKYTITISNTGEDNAYLAIQDDLPEGVTLNSAYYYLDGEKHEITETSNSFELSEITILSNRGIKIILEVQLEELPDDMQSRIIDNFALITGTDIEIKTNTVTYKVIQDSESDEPEQTTYSIRGKVWIDENKNGKRDSSEIGIADTAIKLLDASGNVIKELTTNSEGTYDISELNNGEYIVMFEYNSKLYSITEYQKDTVTSSLNSDAKETIIEGNKVAITDMIKIENSSKTNIDLGLTKNSIFDLKLDKYINMITIQNGQGTTTYSYQDEQFAKVEIPSKYLNDSTAIIEYKIVVTNEGDISGYAKDIVDYLPQDLKFSSELNKEWYVNTDGNLYCASLSDMIINPGETKEVNLILTKKMTENNTGLITNIAEIEKDYNEQGIEEYDSTAGNKVQSEDDISTANVLIGVKTGGIVTYILITLVCVSILIVGIYFINKKVLRGIK